MKKGLRFIILSLFFLVCNTQNSLVTPELQGQRVAYFAGGCFWCMEPPFDELEGVVSTTVGYMGGFIENPTYEIVSTGESGHAEVVKVVYDPNVVTYEELIDVFWRNIDPTALNYQFSDYGSQYRTEIFYIEDTQKNIATETKQKLDQSGRFEDPIVTKITKASKFYLAEEFHQDFYKKNNLRYKMYKKASGREKFFEQIWKENSS